MPARPGLAALLQLYDRPTRALFVRIVFAADYFLAVHYSTDALLKPKSEALCIDVLALLLRRRDARQDVLQQFVRMRP